MLDKFIDEFVTPIMDLRTGENNEGDTLFIKGKPYQVIGTVENKECVILINEKGSFDMIHITKLKPVLNDLEDIHIKDQI